MQMRSAFLASLALATTFANLESAPAQVYPSRPITLVVPLAAGGPIDTTARIVAAGMRASLGQSIIIENITGASGSIGVGRVARAAPDGYTFGIGYVGTHVFNGITYTLSYDLLNDLEPVSLLVTNPLLIVARKAMPAKDLRELIAWLKANPGKALQGTTGVGGSSEIAGVFFQKQTDTRYQLVPYRGAAPMMQDLMAEHIDLMMDFAANSIPQVRAGTIKAYAVTAPSRLPAAPDIPTVDEAGLPKFYISAGFLGAQGNAEGCHRQAQFRGRECPGESSGAAAARRSRTGDLPTRPANARGAGCPAAGRDRQMVADHQGGRHQGRMKRHAAAVRLIRSASIVVRSSASSAAVSARLSDA
jgi:tripartite-type tricarboxylate transporter receptor subunit TctC